MERYKDTEYFVTREGDVYRNEKKLSLSLVKGYKVVTLYFGSFDSRKQKKVHRLVCETYIPNPHNLDQVNHINGNKLDNRVENLEWCNSQYNNIHRSQILKKSIGQEHPKSILSENEIIEIRLRYKRYSRQNGTGAIAKDYNVSKSTIQSIISRKSWKHL